MFKSTCVLLLSAALVLVPGLPSASCAPGHKAPALPHIHGAANLPQPPAGSKLLHIALGFGIQNYTCAGAGSPPSSTGALAVLYDITSLYPGRTRESLPPNTWEGLPSRALWSHDVPLNLDRSGSGASPTRPFPDHAPLRLRGMKRSFPFLGQHFFTSAGVPAFVLDSASGRGGGSVRVLCAKAAAVDAPAAADPGPQGTGAVPWLRLDAKPGSVGPVKHVYRVLTTGGNSHGCRDARAQDSTCYATMYWFFG